MTLHLRHVLQQRFKKTSEGTDILLTRQGIAWEGAGMACPVWMKDLAKAPWLREANAIPKQIALNLCRDIHQTHLKDWYRPAAWRCKRCLQQAKRDIPARLTIGFDYRGCPSVTTRYEQLVATISI